MAGVSGKLCRKWADRAGAASSPRPARPSVQRVADRGQVRLAVRPSCRMSDSTGPSALNISLFSAKWVFCDFIASTIASTALVFSASASVAASGCRASPRVPARPDQRNQAPGPQKPADGGQYLRRDPVTARWTLTAEIASRHANTQQAEEPTDSAP